MNLQRAGKNESAHEVTSRIFSYSGASPPIFEPENLMTKTVVLALVTLAASPAYAQASQPIGRPTLPAGVGDDQPHGVFASGLNQDLKALWDLVVHGNYCGPGSKSDDYSAEPVDELDAACMRHDMCYDDLGRFDCVCDEALADEAGALVGRLGSPELDALAQLIEALFGLNRCLR